jgi:hypothetical protein
VNPVNPRRSQKKSGYLSSMAFELLLGTGRDDQISYLRRQEAPQTAHALDFAYLIGDALFELLVKFDNVLSSLAKFAEKARVLNSNHCLGSKVLHKRDLLVVKGANILTVDGDCADQNPLLEHWHDKKGSSATLIDESDKRSKTRLVSSFQPEVRDMNAPFRHHKTCERNVRHIGLDNQCVAAPRVHIGWFTMPRDCPEGFFLPKEKITKLCFANVRGAG